MTPRRLAAAAALALAGAFALSACGDQGPRPAAVEGSAYMPEPVTEKVAAGYFTLTNEGDEADALTSVTSELSDDVQLHRTVDNTMKRVESFEVPAGGELTLRSGGNHLMLLDLARKPSEGDTVTLRLHFEKSDPLTLQVPVRAKTYRPGEDGSADGAAHTREEHGAHGDHG
ncbi:MULTISPECIES: copper chaperone PCu(A)C [Streptomyces]|uniref:copper chaperone PCu(A)C n=1 Tax=Streptomyces TaxID=1883 RepID=UPI002249534A|nr:copper chaperone PCu(A)C [Streptomyces sp. JHD 1]MCX2967894.1 copper chaperone PCu(A)C [Streptomyces sp. JHD 1]